MDNESAAVREEARKLGGDALVKQLDDSRAKGREISKVLKQMQDEASVETEDKNERALSIVALLEALSEAFANTAVLYGQVKSHQDHEIMVLTVRSVTNNLQSAFADRDAAKDGIIAKIKKGFIAPKAE